MKKRILCAFLILCTFLTLFSGCSNKTKTDKNIVKIAFFSRSSEEDFPLDYLNKTFFGATNIDVEINKISYSNEQELMSKLISKSSSGELGDLIYISSPYFHQYHPDSMIQKLIENEAVIDVKNDLENASEMLSMFNLTSYIPVDLNMYVNFLHKDFSNELNMSNKLFITYDEYFKVQKYFYDKQKLHLTSSNLNFEVLSSELAFYEVQNNKIKFDLKRFENCYNQLKTRVNPDTYIFDFWYEDYEFIINKLKDRSTRDSYGTQAEKSNSLIFGKDERIGRSGNPYKFLSLFSSKNNIDSQYYKGEFDGSWLYKAYSIEDFHPAINVDSSIYTSGFMVLKSSKNKENALKFLDFCLSKHGQEAVITNSILNNLRSGSVRKDAYELIDSALQEANNRIEDPRNHKEFKANKKKLIKNIFNSLETKEFLNLVHSKEKIQSVVFDSFTQSSYQILQRLLIDKHYDLNEATSDLQKLETEINLKLEELL